MGVHPVFPSPVVALGSTEKDKTCVTVGPEDSPLGERLVPQTLPPKNWSETPESNTQ